MSASLRMLLGLNLLRFFSKRSPSLTIFLHDRFAAMSTSSYLIHEPPSTAPRLVPTPLVFVSASKWYPSVSREGFDIFSRMYADKGYTCLDIDISMPQTLTSDSRSMMNHFESELQSAIRLCIIPFAPVIIARGPTCLIAQQYISSHPATGLILISPPPSNTDVDILPTPLPEFDFEPKFPIAIFATPQELDALKVKNRLVRDGGVDVVAVGDTMGQDAFAKIEKWLDEIGV
ncbi:hypothetical protein Moror_106 [Moniliophthora roreri MCA 2997]|uniref:Uncharacterized protein n=2 Tax=Moniliophthora roreri TaxID=221103 RepID=V2XZS0_MONRO|nr:hypothetical protein Moror_106 [Moniliophthora roreri MCA 2997]KAI3622594.1 hypothetical protein WG66_015473 [Moniliophthora roreri]